MVHLRASSMSSQAAPAAFPSPIADRPGLAYVVNSLNPGGTERLVVQMSQSFCREFAVFVVCLDEPGLWAAGLRREGIPVYSLWRQPGMDLSMAVQLARFCKQHRIEILHAHQTTPWFYGGLSRWIHEKPRLLFQEHGRFFPEVENRTKAFVNRAFIKPVTHRFIAVSEDVKKRLEKYEGLEGAHIEVVYNGVIPEVAPDVPTRNQLRHEFGFGPQHVVIGTAGRFDPIKNLPLLLRSLAALCKENQSVRGLILGDGPVFDEIQTLRDQLGLADTVVMPGHRDDARRLIGCMDLFVLSSLSEGTSLALLEAMAAGVPVAVTAVGGNPEIVTARETGWLVDSDSVGQLTAALRDAASHPEKARHYGENGRRRFEERFSFDKMISAYRGIYSEMLASSGRVP